MLLGKASLTARAVPLHREELCSQGVYLLDVDEDRTLYLWLGKDAEQVRRQKACLFCEKSGATGRCTVTIVEEGSESEDFLAIFQEAEECEAEALKAAKMQARDARRKGGRGTAVDTAADDTAKAAKAAHPPGSDPTLGHVTKLHEMRLGDGFLELPQVVPAGHELKASMLLSEKVYILDDYTDVVIWLGRRSSRLVRAAAARVAYELQRILPRPPHFLLSTVTEGTEPLVFKSKFSGWDDMIAPDYRARDVVRVEANLATKALMRRARDLRGGLASAQLQGEAELHGTSWDRQGGGRGGRERKRERE